MDTDEQKEVYEQFLAACEAYDALSADEQAQVNDSKLDELADYFNGEVTVAEAVSVKWTSENSVEISPKYDITLWKDNNPSATADSMEVRYVVDSEGNTTKDMLGLMRFVIPTKEGKEIKSATLRLVTERVKSGSNEFGLYTIDTDDRWEDETISYSTLSDAISAARETDAIATFVPSGKDGKAIFDTGLPDDYYGDVSAWTNEIDVTSVISAGENFDFIISTQTSISDLDTRFFSKDYASTRTWQYIDDNNDTIKGDTIAADDVVPVLTIEYMDVVALPEYGIRYNFQTSTDYTEDSATWNSNNSAVARTSSNSSTFSLSVKAQSQTNTYRMTSEPWDISVLSDGDDGGNIHPANTWSLYIPFTNNVKVEKIVVHSVNSPQICALIKADDYMPENIAVNTTSSDVKVFSSDNWWRVGSISSIKNIDNNYSTPTQISVGTDSSGNTIYEDVLELADGGTAVEYAGLLIDNNNSTGVYVTEIEVYGTEVYNPNPQADIVLESGTITMSLTVNANAVKDSIASDVKVTINGEKPRHNPAVVTENDGTYTIKQKILASQMADKVVFEFPIKDGRTGKVETSVKEYAATAIEQLEAKTNDETAQKEIAVINAMLDYGSAVQALAAGDSGIGNDKLANGGNYQNDDVTADQIKEAGGTKSTTTGTTSETGDTPDDTVGTSWTGATLVSMNMNFNYNFNLAMTYSESIAEYAVTVTHDGE